MLNTFTFFYFFMYVSSESSSNVVLVFCLNFDISVLWWFTTIIRRIYFIITRTKAIFRFTSFRKVNPSTTYHQHIQILLLSKPQNCNFNAELLEEIPVMRLMRNGLTFPISNFSDNKILSSTVVKYHLFVASPCQTVVITHQRPSQKALKEDIKPYIRSSHCHCCRRQPFKPSYSRDIKFNPITYTNVAVIVHLTRYEQNAWRVGEQT